MKSRLFIGLLGLALSAGSVLAESNSSMLFDFGAGELGNGFTRVDKDSLYSAKSGFGFLGAPRIGNVELRGEGPLKSDGCSSNEPFTFAVDLPEGDYDVNLLLGGAAEEEKVTVKAEARRVMLSNVKIAPNTFEQVGFTVNIRTPDFGSNRRVSLNDREKGPPLSPQWDGRLTLEFLGDHITIVGMEIVPSPKAITVFIAGDSTVTDQGNEPWAGWGQLLPQYFKQGVAIANYAESGRALYSFRGEKRLEKIFSAMKAGDYLFIQFGHNDQKNKSPGAGPFTSYKKDLVGFVAATRKANGIPVLVTPMERRRWKDGRPEETLAEYAEAVRQVGREEKVPVIDLHAMSLKFYKAMGEKGSTAAFVHYPANTFPGQEERLRDDTHHNVYGANELARCVVEGIRSEVPALAKHLREDVGTFDPSKPDDPSSLEIPASPLAVTEKPEGN